MRLADLARLGIQLREGGGKPQRLRGKIMRESGVFALAILMLVGVLVGISLWHTSVMNEHNRARSEATRVGAEVDTLRGKLSRAEQSLPIYRSLLKNGKPDVSLDRQYAGETLQALRGEYLFASLRIGIQPLKPMDPARFSNKFVAGEMTEITLTIDALTDVDIAKFFERVKSLLPGRLKITAINITRVTDITAPALATLAQGGRVSFVKADIRIQWMGMQEKDAGKKPAPASAGPKP